MENMFSSVDLKYKNISILFFEQDSSFLFIYLLCIGLCFGFGFIEMPTAAEALECFVSLLLVLVLQKLPLA